MRPGRRRSPFVSAALGVVVAAGVFFVAEGALRVAGVQPAYQADAVGGWRMLPEMRAKRMESTREQVSFTVTTNADGLRTYLERAKTPGRRRVALLGDSTVFGWGVDNGGTVADGLAAGLAERGVDIEVLNAGQPGYTTTQMTVLYESVVRLYEPDLTVVFVPMHDDNRVLVSDREHLDGAAGPLAALRVGLATHSRVYQALRQRIFPLSAEPYLVPGKDVSTEPRVPRVSAAERDANLDTIRARASEWGGRVAVGHLPFLADLEGVQGEERFAVPWARAYAEAHGTPIVDLRGCCAGQGGATLTLPHDPGHLTAVGNALVGRSAVDPVLAALTAPIAGSSR